MTWTLKNLKGNLRFWLVMMAVFALGSLVFTAGIIRREHLVFGATYMTMNNPFYQVINTELRKAVTEHGDSLVVRDPLMNADRQIEQVEQFIADDVKKFETLALGFDPMQATQMAQDLLKDGVPMVELFQNLTNFSEPMKLVQALIYSGRIHFNSNPVMHWMACNVAVSYTHLTLPTKA